MTNGRGWAGSDHANCRCHDHKARFGGPTAQFCERSTLVKARDRAKSGSIRRHMFISPTSGRKHDPPSPSSRPSAAGNARIGRPGHVTGRQASGAPGEWAAKRRGRSGGQGREPLAGRPASRRTAEAGPRGRAAPDRPRPASRSASPGLECDSQCRDDLRHRSGRCDREGRGRARGAPLPQTSGPYPQHAATSDQLE